MMLLLSRTPKMALEPHLHRSSSQASQAPAPSMVVNVCSARCQLIKPTVNFGGPSQPHLSQGQKTGKSPGTGANWGRGHRHDHQTQVSTARRAAESSEVFSY